MNINERCLALPVIHSQKVEWSKGENKNNIITLPFPIYSDEVDAWIKAFYSLEIADKDYINNSKKIAHKDISELTRDETLTRITAVIRAERFCDGTIAEALENGLLEKLCLHLHETADRSSNNI